MLAFSRYFILIILLLFAIVRPTVAEDPPQKEFRGVWIATINNIDWPSSPDLSPDKQKKEFLQLLDVVESFNLNTIILQVRPAADAIYPSDTEPWSWFLTGKQGLAPYPAYDPLAWAIEVCHQRGLELHAWFNPFRIRNNGYYPLYQNSFASSNQQFTCNYDNKLFFDPGYPQVRDQIIKVISEVVRKYDIDAVHLDDYFYPYPIKGKPFPDNKSFAKYGKPRYQNRLSDWRRDNINQFISALHDSIKTIKPFMKFGISPFGIWRNQADDPAGSGGAKGMSSYDDLFADVRKWLKEGWIDYVIPQLYWEQGHRYGDFLSLASWWNKNSFGKPLYIGQALYKSTNSSWDNPKEIGEQIRILREQDKINGFAFYSISHLKKLSKNQMSYLADNFLQAKAGQYDSRRDQDTTRVPIDIGTLANKGVELVLAEGHIINPFDISDGSTDLPVAEKLSMKKSGKGWTISWKPDKNYEANKIKFVVVTFQPEKQGGYLKKVQSITENQQLFLTKSEQALFRNKLICIIAINDKDEFGHISKLYKIKGRKIILN